MCECLGFENPQKCKLASKHKNLRGTTVPQAQEKRRNETSSSRQRQAEPKKGHNIQKSRNRSLNSAVVINVVQPVHGLALRL